MGQLQINPRLNIHVVICRYESDEPTQGTSVDCGLFVIAAAKLRCIPMQFDQGNMHAMRRQLAEELLGLGMSYDRLLIVPMISVVCIY